MCWFNCCGEKRNNRHPGTQVAVRFFKLDSVGPRTCQWPHCYFLPKECCHTKWVCLDRKLSHLIAADLPTTRSLGFPLFPLFFKEQLHSERALLADQACGNSSKMFQGSGKGSSRLFSVRLDGAEMASACRGMTGEEDEEPREEEGRGEGEGEEKRREGGGEAGKGRGGAGVRGRRGERERWNGEESVKDGMKYEVWKQNWW